MNEKISENEKIRLIHQEIENSEWSKRNKFYELLRVSKKLPWLIFTAQKDVKKFNEETKKASEKIDKMTKIFNNSDVIFLAITVLLCYLLPNYISFFIILLVYFSVKFTCNLLVNLSDKDFNQTAALIALQTQREYWKEWDLSGLSLNLLLLKLEAYEKQDGLSQNDLKVLTDQENELGDQSRYYEFHYQNVLNCYELSCGESEK